MPSLLKPLLDGFASLQLRAALSDTIKKLQGKSAAKYKTRGVQVTREAWSLEFRALRTHWPTMGPGPGWKPLGCLAVIGAAMHTICSNIVKQRNPVLKTLVQLQYTFYLLQQAEPLFENFP